MRSFLHIRSLVASLLCMAALFASVTLRADSRDDKAIAAIHDVIARTQPEMVVVSIKPSPIAGLYEVQLKDGQTVYASADAKYLIPGDLYESKPDGLVNLGDARRSQVRKEKIAAIDEKDMIIFAPKGERKATLTVFTDVDCPYCRKLHSEIGDLNSRGIAVRYLAFPRTGLKGESYEKIKSTWCSSDRKAALTLAKLGGDIPAAKCDNPVDKEFHLGQEVGVTGTPAIVLEDGTMLPGYVPAAALAGYLFGDAD
ncbi:MAG TPA: DsbC family protein [Candidatus Acidoferrum sp.]|nr:DsbC family protein [Candidatus Acidoferrum sp.]